MKLTIVDNAVVATAENENENIVLLRLATVVQKTAIESPQKRGAAKRKKYFSKEEIAAAKRRYARKYYKKHRAAKEAAKRDIVNNAGVAVPINVIPS